MIRHPTGPEHLGEHVRRSTSAVRRACAVGTTVALIGLTTGLGIMTATSASAVTNGDTSAVVQPNGTGTTADGSTGSDAGATGTDTNGSGATGSGTTDTDAGASDTNGSDTDAGGSATDADAGGTTNPSDGTTGTGTTDTDTDGQDLPADQQPATGPTTPTATTPDSTVQPLAAPTWKVAIDGVAKVGASLTAEPSGFTAPTNLSYSWTANGTEVGQAPVYVVKAADAGKILRVTVTNTQGGVPIESESAATAPVTQTPVFVDADGTPITDGTEEDGLDLVIDATAGEQFSYTFRATGFPEPQLALAWYYGDDDGSGTPADQLPEGVSFNPKTGVLTGSTKEATDYVFAVTATSGAGTTGAVTTTQWVDLVVAPAAAAGLEAVAVDRATFLDFVQSGFSDALPGDDGAHSGSLTSWIIGADGSVSTVQSDYESDAEGGSDFETTTPGGTVTVPQGGTLLVSGTLVDRFGNPVADDTDFGLADITVRSNVASDVIALDPQLGIAGFVGVTFPHASVHRLTVAADAFSTAFDVQVTPTAVTPAPITPAATTPIGTVQHGTITASPRGTLAYTGTDSTSALPWALGLVLVGAGLIGARTLRRRRTER